jgi:hypothetical protein
MLEEIQNKNQYQRMSILNSEEKADIIIKLRSEGANYKLLASMLSCEVNDIVDFLKEVDLKFCTCCKTTKSFSEFHKTNERRDGHVEKCNDCCHEKRKYYYELDRGKGKAESKKWKDANRKVLNNRRNLRKLTDVSFQLNYWMSNSIYISLRRKSVSKNSFHWEDLVEYTLDDLKLHLEKQFSKDMNWQNHGTYWELDHIVPVSAFNFVSLEDISFKKCWSLINLRPLEKSINNLKSNKISLEWENVELAKKLLDKDIV